MSPEVANDREIKKPCFCELCVPDIAQVDFAPLAEAPQPRVKPKAERTSETVALAA